MLNVVLVHPQIAPNTGNVIRLCANTGAALHLVEPLGFALDSARMRRAGLDYHEYTAMLVHPSWAALRARHPLSLGCTANGAAPDGSRAFALTTRATRTVYDTAFTAGDWLVFGCETSGLPLTVLDEFAPQQRLRLPMRPNNRSLNLSNAVAVTVFEAWRQLGFDGASNS